MQNTDSVGIRKPVRGVESFSNFERSLPKGKRNGELENVQTSQMENEKILSDQRTLHGYLEKKARSASQGECAAQRR